MSAFTNTVLAATLATLALPALAQDFPQRPVSQAAYATANKMLETSYLITADGSVVGPAVKVGQNAAGEDVLHVRIQFGVTDGNADIYEVVSDNVSVVNGQFIVPILAADLMAAQG